MMDRGGSGQDSRPWRRRVVASLSAARARKPLYRKHKADKDKSHSRPALTLRVKDGLPPLEGAYTPPPEGPHRSMADPQTRRSPRPGERETSRWADETEEDLPINDPATWRIRGAKARYAARRGLPEFETIDGVGPWTRLLQEPPRLIRMAASLAAVVLLAQGLNLGLRVLDRGLDVVRGESRVAFNALSYRLPQNGDQSVTDSEGDGVIFAFDAGAASSPLTSDFFQWARENRFEGLGDLPSPYRAIVMERDAEATRKLLEALPEGDLESRVRLLAGLGLLERFERQMPLWLGEGHSGGLAPATFSVSLDSVRALVEAGNCYAVGQRVNNAAAYALSANDELSSRRNDALFLSAIVPGARDCARRRTEILEEIDLFRSVKRIREASGPPVEIVDGFYVDGGRAPADGDDTRQDRSNSIRWVVAPPEIASLVRQPDSCQAQTPSTTGRQEVLAYLTGVAAFRSAKFDLAMQCFGVAGRAENLRLGELGRFMSIRTAFWHERIGWHGAPMPLSVTEADWASEEKSFECETLAADSACVITEYRDDLQDIARRTPRGAFERLTRTQDVTTAALAGDVSYYVEEFGSDDQPY